MKLNSLFKTCIDIAFFLLVPVVIFFPGTVLYMLFFPQQSIINFNVPFQDGGFTGASVLFLVVLFIEFLLFFFGFFNLRKLAGLTLKKTFLIQETALRLKRIGQFFSICGGSSLIIYILYKIFSSASTTSLSFGFTEVCVLLFLTIIGVLFLMLGSAFNKVITPKTENNISK